MCCTTPCNCRRIRGLRISRVPSSGVRSSSSASSQVALALRVPKVGAIVIDLVARDQEIRSHTPGICQDASPRLFVISLFVIVTS